MRVGFRRGATALVAALVATAALPVVATAATASVSMRDDDGFYFHSAYKVILVGDQVTWTNDTDEQHTVTSFPGSAIEFDSSPETPEGEGEQDPCVPPLLSPPRDCLDPGETYTVSFDRPGTYHYYCKAHGSTAETPNGRSGSDQPCGMCGTVEVKRKPDPKPLPRRDPDPTPTRTARATASPSPETSPSPTPTATGTEGAVAAGSGGGGGGSGRTAIAFVLVLALGGAGWWTWRRFLAPG